MGRREEIIKISKLDIMVNRAIKKERGTCDGDSSGIGIVVVVVVGGAGRGGRTPCASGSNLFHSQSIVDESHETTTPPKLPHDIPPTEDHGLRDVLRDPRPASGSANVCHSHTNTTNCLPTSAVAEPSRQVLGQDRREWEEGEEQGRERVFN